MTTDVKLMLGAHVAVATVVMLVYIFIFSLPFHLLILHVLLVFSIYVMAFFSLQFFPIQFYSIKILFFSSLSFFLICVYVANFFSNSFFSSNVNFKFVVNYGSQLNEILGDVSYAMTSIFIFLMLLWVICLFLYKSKASGLFKQKDRFNFKEARFSITISVITVVFLSLTFDPMDPKIWAGEPLSNLFLNNVHANYQISIASEQGKEKDNYVFSSAGSDKPNIIFIHADAMRADHMSAYNYARETTPYIDSLIAQGAYKVDIGLSICSESICGMLAALASQEIDKLKPGSKIIHHVLKKANYKNYFMGSGDFSWERIDEILGKDIDAFVRADKSPDFSIHDDSIILDGLAKIPSSTGQPGFFFLRFMSSHPAGKHIPQYAKFLPSERNIFSFLFPSLQKEVALNGYDNYLLQADAFIKQSLRLLKEKGYLENFIVVIYGDHGDAYGEHGYYGHYANLYQEEIHVPIIFWSSKQYKWPKLAYATLFDIAPTVFEMAGLDVPSQFEGTSLLERQDSKISYHNSRTGVYGIVFNEADSVYKYIINTKMDNSEFLFELKNDPGERVNLVNVFSKEKTKQYRGAVVKHFNLDNS